VLGLRVNVSPLLSRISCPSTILISNIWFVPSRGGLVLD
jgi:hypothetical protein